MILSKFVVIFCYCDYKANSNNSEKDFYETINYKCNGLKMKHYQIIKIQFKSNSKLDLSSLRTG